MTNKTPKHPKPDHDEPAKTEKPEHVEKPHKTENVEERSSSKYD